MAVLWPVEASYFMHIPSHAMERYAPALILNTTQPGHGRPRMPGTSRA